MVAHENAGVIVSTTKKIKNKKILNPHPHPPPPPLTKNIFRKSFFFWGGGEWQLTTFCPLWIGTLGKIGENRKKLGIYQAWNGKNILPFILWTDVL